MAKIKVEDLPKVQDMSEEECSRVFGGAGGFGALKGVTGGGGGRVGRQSAPPTLPDGPGLGAQPLAGALSTRLVGGGFGGTAAHRYT